MQLVDLQTSRDVPQYCYALVMREVVSCVRSQQLENVSQRLFVLVLLAGNGRRFCFRRQHDAARVARISMSLAGISATGSTKSTRLLLEQTVEGDERFASTGFLKLDYPGPNPLGRSVLPGSSFDHGSSFWNLTFRVLDEFDCSHCVRVRYVGSP
jgi:hypothetical protein